MRPFVPLVALFLPLVAVGAGPDPAAVIAAARRAADYQLAHPAKAPTTDWTQATFAAGLMELYRASGDVRYHDAMARIGDDNGWKPGPKPFDADDHCIGQAYVEMWFADHRPEEIAPLRATFDNVLAHPQTQSLDFDKVKNPRHRDRWSWCDSLFMAPPAWVRLAAATGDRRYRDFAERQWWVTSDFLYDPAEHLFFRDNTFFARREANGKKVYWSRGNGWVLAGLARVLPYLPKDDPERPRFERQFRELGSRIESLQQPDGFWRASLLDPDHYPAKESSGTGLDCYALAWGARTGELDRGPARAAAEKAWAALASCEEADGRFTRVQPVAGSPKPFDPESTTAYGVGAFLLAAGEIAALESAQ